MTKPEILLPSAINEALKDSPWNREGMELVLTTQFASFAEALGFVTSVGVLAESQDHHPDIDIRYREVRLTLTTHEVSGITARDLKLAESVSQLLV